MDGEVRAVAFGSRLRDWANNALACSILGFARLLPYRLRGPFVGTLAAYVVAPLIGWRARILENLDHAMPELPAAERRRIARRVPDNFGRTMIEIYSGEEFVAHARAATMEGPGVAALEAAREARRPVILVTAHFGNYDVPRAKLSREGCSMAALYRPMRNAAFNAHYVKAISTVASPVFPTSRKGIAGLIRHLKGGGVIGLVADISMAGAPLLTFFGREAHTALSAAEWALACDAEIIPLFGVRKDDGRSFCVRLEAPLARSTPERMMQEYNDIVERMARAHPAQWLWIHRRWKRRPGRARPAASGQLKTKDSIPSRITASSCRRDQAARENGRQADGQEVDEAGNRAFGRGAGASRGDRA